MFNEYASIAQLILDFVLWFALGGCAFYMIVSTLEYFNGPKD